MDLKDLVEIVPKLLLLFVPGYVAFTIKEKFCLEKKKDSFDVTLYSILYSFIVGILFSIIETVLSSIFKGTVTFLQNDTVRQAAHLLIAVLLGYSFVKVHNSKIGTWIEQRFNKNLVPDSCVWNKAMENSDGAWATVYLENGLIYTGMLINYTSDPNDESKEILLSNFRLAVRCEGTVAKAEDFCQVIVDNTKKSNAHVFLKRDDIVSIEIIS